MHTHTRYVRPKISRIAYDARESVTRRFFIIIIIITRPNDDLIGPQTRRVERVLRPKCEYSIRCRFPRVFVAYFDTVQQQRNDVKPFRRESPENHRPPATRLRYRSERREQSILEIRAEQWKNRVHRCNGYTRISPFIFGATRLRPFYPKKTQHDRKIYIPLSIAE